MAKQKMTKTLVENALIAEKGAVYLAAKRLKCSHTTVYSFINKYKDLAELKEYYDEEATDIAVSRLRDAITTGDPWAIKFQLSTKGKDRGYVERQEITGADGNTITVKLLGDDGNEN